MCEGEPGLQNIPEELGTRASPFPEIPMASTVQQQELHKLLPLPFCAWSSVRLDLGLIS